MQIRQQRRHLLIREPSGESRHQAAAIQHIRSHSGIRCRNAARQRLVFKETTQIGWDFLERKIIILVAMSTTHVVEMRPFRLFGCKPLSRVAASKTNGQECSEQYKSSGG